MGTTHHQVEYRSEYSAMEIHAVLCEKYVSAILKTHVMIPKFSNMLNTGLYASVPRIMSWIYSQFTKPGEKINRPYNWFLEGYQLPAL